MPVFAARWPRWRLHLGLLLAGAAQACSLAWPFDWGVQRGAALWPLQVLAMAYLVGAIQRAPNPWVAAWRGGLFAWAWLAWTVAWLFVSMHQYGGLPAALAVAAVLTLAAALALYTALASGCFWALTSENKASQAIIFAACWLLAELARGLLLTGFGWGGVGYAHVDSPLAGALPWVGQYGVGALAAGVAAALLQGWRARLGALAVVGALAWMGHAGWGVPPAPPAAAEALRVDVLQGNIAQEEKFGWGTGIAQALRGYGQGLRDSPAQLVITPETALPVLPEQLPEGYWAALHGQFARPGRAALVGMPLGDADSGYTNSVVGLAPGQPDWRYDKHHLVPFGEFIPPGFRWFTELMHIPLGDFARGDLPQPPFVWAGQRLAVGVCYENLFSEEMATAFADASLAPTVLVNVSNLGWFGQHLAMDQHLAIARVRAIEFARPSILATNTGHSAVLDARGRVTHAAQPHTTTVLRAQVVGVQTGLTPYARWASRWGQTPLVIGALLVLAWAAWRKRACPRP